MKRKRNVEAGTDGHKVVFAAAGTPRKFFCANCAVWSLLKITSACKMIHKNYPKKLTH